MPEPTDTKMDASKNSGGNDPQQQETPVEPLSQETTQELLTQDAVTENPADDESSAASLNDPGATPAGASEKSSLQEETTVDDAAAQEKESSATMDMDTDKGLEQTEETLNAEAGQEEEAVQEKSYSTRGRAGDLAADPLEKLARDALGDLAREKETPISLGASFLSDALTEEERRTRTRYLPEVDGMYALRKNEIKGDLALARSIQSSTGVASTVTFKAKAKRAREDDGVESVDEEGAAPSEDDRMSDSVRLGTKTIEIRASDMIIPSTAFVAPNGDGGASKRDRPSPHEIEAVTAFNPPRPPESIGAKKKHRMLRWERRPADIEVDLSNYRKTVNKTREELKNAQSEAERVEMVENHLRRHYFHHLQCLNDEWIQLNAELSSAHQECVNAADLLTSRTRSRGAGKGSYVMKDVLAVLSARGAEIDEKGLLMDTAPVTEMANKTPGIGGVGAASFKDWDHSTTISSGKVASGWVTAGDKVQTPYGVGTAISVYGPSGLNVMEAPHSGLTIKSSAQKLIAQSGTKDTSADMPMPDVDAAPSEAMELDAKAGDAAPGAKKQGNGAKKKDDLESTGKITAKHMLAPRIAVRMPFGVGFYPVDSVMSLEDPSRYSDARLAERWKGMGETAALVGGILDMEAMADIEAAEPRSDPMDTTANMAVDETTGSGEGAIIADKERTPRLVPFGSGLLPTSSGRGALMPVIDLTELDSELNMVLTKGAGVLGLPDNTGVPPALKELEVQRQEHLDLQARVLQLRNELYRQRRTRMLNEKTAATTQERCSRVEALVAEMRTDLKSLKSRLDEEIRELGISEAQAENLLTSFYQSLDSKHSGQASPPKRPRRLSRADLDETDGMSDEGISTDLASDMGLTKQ